MLVSSHLMSEMAQTADHLVVIGRGRLLADDHVAELSARSNSLEEAFFALTEGSTDYSASNLAYQGSLCMTTVTLTRSATQTAGGGYGFRSVARMEWLKLRSVRSTAWTLLVFAAGMIGLSVLVLSHQHWATMSAADRASFDPTEGLHRAGARPARPRRPRRARHHHRVLLRA